MIGVPLLFLPLAVGSGIGGNAGNAAPTSRLFRFFGGNITHMGYVSRGNSKYRWGPRKSLRVTVDVVPR